MNKTTKITLIVASLLIIFGGIISVVAITFGGMTPHDVDLQTQTVTQTVADKITKIDVSVAFDDIIIKSSDTNKMEVTYYTGKTKQYNFSTDNNTLLLKSLPTDIFSENWIDHINFSSTDIRDIFIEVPKSFEGEIIISTDYGDIKASDLKGSINLKSDSGDIEVIKGNFTTAIYDVDYGDVEISGVTAKTMDIDNDYGDVDIKATKADTITIEDNCGSIDIEDVSANITAHCDMGDIEIERVSGDKLEFTNNFGDIKGVILGNEFDYSIISRTDLGDNNLKDRSGGSKTLEAKTDLGDIEIMFFK